MNGGRQSGTDLFSEVEEKRKLLEKENISFKVRAEKQQRALSAGEHQRRSLRNQIAMLMTTRGNKADAAKLRRLEQALSQSKSETLVITLYV